MDQCTLRLMKNGMKYSKFRTHCKLINYMLASVAQLHLTVIRTGGCGFSTPVESAIFFCGD